MLADEQVWIIARNLLKTMVQKPSFERARVDPILIDTTVPDTGKFTDPIPITTFCADPGGSAPRGDGNPLHRRVWEAMKDVRDRSAEEDRTPGEVDDLDSIQSAALVTLEGFLAHPIARRLDEDSFVDLLCMCLWRAIDSGFEFTVSVGLGAATSGVPARLPGYVIPLLNYLVESANREMGGSMQAPTVRIFSAATLGDLNGLDVSSAVRHAFYQFLLIDEFINKFSSEAFWADLRYEMYRDTPEKRDEAQRLADTLERALPLEFAAVRPKILSWAERRGSATAVLYACMHPIMFTDWTSSTSPHAVVSYGGIAEKEFRVLRRLCIETIRTLSPGYEFPLNVMWVSRYHKAPPYNFAKDDLLLDTYLATDSATVMAKRPLRDDYDLLHGFTTTERHYRDFLAMFVAQYPPHLVESPGRLQAAFESSAAVERLTPFTRELLERVGEM